METGATAEELDAGRGYEALFVASAFEPWTKHLIEGAGVSQGDRVLDIGVGAK